MAQVLVATLLLAMGALFAVITSGHSLNLGLATAAILGLLGISFCFLLAVVFGVRAGLADVIIAYFVSISVAYAGLYQELAARFPWPESHSQTDLLIAVLIYAAFLLSYWLGTSSVSSCRPDRRVVEQNHLYISYAMVLLLGSLACMRAVGFSMVLSSRVEIADVGLETADSQLVMVGKSLALVAYLLLLSMVINHRKRTNWKAAALLVLAGVIALLWFNPIVTARFHFIAFVLSTVALLFPTLSRTWKAVVMICFFLGNYFIFGPLKSLSSLGGSDDVSSAFIDGVSKYAFRVDFDSMQVSANGVAYFSIYPFLYMKNIVGSALFFIPRSIWTDKPIGTGIEVHEGLMYAYTNLSFPLPMEFYAAGGFISVIILGAIFGIGVRRLTMKGIANSRSGGLGLANVSLAILIGYLPIIMRGSLNSVVPQFGFAFLAVGMLQLLGRISIKERSLGI